MSNKKVNNKKTRKASAKNIIINGIDIADFRKTFYMDDIKYKKPNKPNFNVTDKEIIKYLESLDARDIKYIQDDIQEIKTYMSLDNKINFKPVTVDWIRKNAWNKKTKKWMPFKYHYENGADPNRKYYGPVYVQKVTDRNKRDKVFCAEFQPDGDLNERNQKTGEKKVYKNWLSGDKPGPYKYETRNYANKKHNLYFLSGKGTFCGGKKRDLYLQICENNYVSDNCTDGPNWIEAEPNDLLE